MKHKHADFIHAWADGKAIQITTDCGRTWVDVTSPNWTWDTHELVEYRIKPEPKPDVVLKICAEKISPRWIKVYDLGEFILPNLMLTFCGETGKLKAAEVL